ncbi:MAG: glycosyltransferase family 4 protein [candidate division WOR-3 bacterium]
MKILVIGHMHVNPQNREIFQMLMEEYDVRIIYPKLWTGEFGEKYFDENGFKKIKFPFTKNGYIPIINDKEFYDLLWIDEEPYLPQTYFILKNLKYKRSILRGAQNILKKDVFRDTLYNFVKNRVDLFVGVGEGSKQVLEEIFKKETKIVPLHIPDEFFLSEDKNFSKERLTLGFAGRLEENKGVKLLIEILKNLKQDYKIKISGKGKEEKLLLDFLKSSKIDYQFLGFVEHKNMPNFYKDVDIFINLSQDTTSWKEQQGRAILEAMASKCVVLTTGSFDIEKNFSGSAVIVNFNSNDPLNALNELFEKREKLYEFSVLGYRRAKMFSKFEILRLINGIIEEYVKPFVC